MAVVVLLASPATRANGRYPATQQLVVMPESPGTLVVRSTFGLLLSHDQGASWDWVCESAVGYGGVEDPAIAVTGSGAVLVAAFEGLAVSPDTGCMWSMAGGRLAQQFFVDVAVRPGSPHGAVALASTYDGEGGVQSNATELFLSTDDGASWTAYGDPIDPSFAADTVEWAASDPHRLYLTATKLGPPHTAALFVSKTDGTQWVEHDIALLANEASVYLAAVDPMNADRVYVRTADRTASQFSRLLVSDDGGSTFTERYRGGTMQGFALSADGSTVYLGGPNDGLQVARTSDLQFTQRSPIAVQCLALGGATLYACSSDASGFILGASSDEGATFVPLLHLCGVRGPLACPAGTSASACTKKWPTIQQANGGPCAVDAGADASASPPSLIKAGGGCSSSGWAGGLGGSFVALAAAVLIGMLRRVARWTIR